MDLKSTLTFILNHNGAYILYVHAGLLVLWQCQYNSAYCNYDDYFERVATNMGFCLSFNPSKISYCEQNLNEMKIESYHSLTVQS